jgi:autotransporter passenger strand-loop-strand repeat protein
LTPAGRASRPRSAAAAWSQSPAPCWGEAVDRNATISSGGTQIVGFAGVVVATAVDGGATQIVSAGGLASGAMVAGGFQFISGGAASNTTVTSHGEVDVFSAGRAFNATVKAGGLFLVQSGGFASSTVVKIGGDETVGVGGTASGVIVSSGGTFEWFGSNPIVAGAQFRSGATVAVGSGYVFSGNVSGGITELIFLAVLPAVRRSAAPVRLSKAAASLPTRRSRRAANRWCWTSALRPPR